MSLLPSEEQAGIPAVPHINGRWQRVAASMTSMTASPDGASLRATIQEIVPEALGAVDCAFIVLDESCDQIVFESRHQYHHSRKPTPDFEIFRTWLVSQPTVVVIDDCRTVTWPSQVQLTEPKTMQPVLIVQDKVDPAMFNLLVVFGESVAAIFSDEDLEVARALTVHAGLAVRHVLREENARREVMGRTALYEVGKRISASLAMDEVLSLIIDSLQRVVPYDAAVIFLLEPEQDRIVVQSGRGYGEDADSLIHLKVGDGISGWAAKTGLAVIVPDVKTDDRYAQSRSETMSEMAVPLMKGLEVIGVFNIESDRIDAYDEMDRALLESFASQAAVAIQNANLHEESLRTRQLEKELEVAGDIQRMLMPRKFPTVSGLSLNVYHEQCMEVGGDFYDAFALSNQYIAMAVGDVAGKGVPGAITMASLYTVFHEYATDPLNTPSDVMTVVNERLHDDRGTDLFATLFYGVLSLSNGNMRYCNAGHPPPILYRTDGSVSLLDTGGLILGPFLKAEYQVGSVDISEGDVLVLYTDGAIEARNKKNEQFEIEGLIRVLQTCPGLSADEIKEFLTTALKRHTGGSTHHDDVTIITLKVMAGFHSALRVE
jgi:phosphoserine phosphatase RsbU/P